MMHSSEIYNEYKSMDPLYTRWERNYKTKSTNQKPTKAFIRNAENNNLKEERR